MDVELIKDRGTIKAGDKIKMLLVASKDDKMTRMSRGIDRDAFTGTAARDLEVGESFRLDVGFDYITTSAVKYIGQGMFTTQNSTYSFEHLNV